MKKTIMEAKYTMTQNNEIQLVDSVFSEKQDVVQDVKYQDITYYKWDKDEAVCSRDHIHIDFLNAMSEMSKLDWTFSHNHIGFKNNRTNEVVQFIRLGKNKWHVENLVNHGVDWKGYVWTAKSDNTTMSYMMKLFFEEGSWFEMLNWNLKKVA